MGMIAVAESCRQLTALGLHCCRRLTDASMAAIAFNLSRLVRLNVSGCLPMSSKAVQVLPQRDVTYSSLWFIQTTLAWRPFIALLLPDCSTLTAPVPLTLFIRIWSADHVCLLCYGAPIFLVLYLIYALCASNGKKLIKRLYTLVCFLLHRLWWTPIPACTLAAASSARSSSAAVWLYWVSAASASATLERRRQRPQPRWIAELPRSKAALDFLQTSGPVPMCQTVQHRLEGESSSLTLAVL